MEVLGSYLRVFPVGYEVRGGHAAPATRTRHLRRGSSSPVDIMFFNSFPGARGHRGHRAIDILGGLGLPIYAARAGVIPDRWRVRRDGQPHDLPGSGRDDRGGNFVVIVDDEGLYHYYCHLESPPKHGPGAVIHAGTLIGYLGGSGSRGRGRHQHLHYQVTERNVAGALVQSINPYRELVRLARAAGGAFEVLSIEGYRSNMNWMCIRPENYRR